MAKLSKDFSAGVLHPRENIYSTGTLGALNAEIQIDAHGCNSVSVDLRGTFSLTVEVAFSIDGTNWIVVPVRPATGGVFVAAIAGAAAGAWGAGLGATALKVRARVTAYTSGSATCTLMAGFGLFDDFAKNGGITSQIVTATGAAAAAVTATLTAPGAGLRHYLTYLSMNRVNGTAAALTASATPVVCTTTNLPGSLAFTRAADALAAGAADLWREDFAFPLMSSAQNTATTIVCPATTGVIWRVTVGYYVAP